MQQLNLKRVINNLVSNALKHTNSGKVILYTGLVESDELNDKMIEDYLHVGATIDSKTMYIMFEIKDNGRGIP